MITQGEYRIKQVVAVWRNEQTGQLQVLPPRGVCREFMRQIDDANLDAEIILDLDLDRDRTQTLRELLPTHEWPKPLDL